MATKKKVKRKKKQQAEGKEFTIGDDISASARKVIRRKVVPPQTQSETEADVRRSLERAKEEERLKRAPMDMQDAPDLAKRRKVKRKKKKKK